MDTDHWFCRLGTVLPDHLFFFKKLIVHETEYTYTLNDIKLLVNSFYEKVRKDKLLAPIFNERIQDLAATPGKDVSFLANRVAG